VGDGFAGEYAAVGTVVDVGVGEDTTVARASGRTAGSDVEAGVLEVVHPTRKIRNAVTERRTKGRVSPRLPFDNRFLLL